MAAIKSLQVLVCAVLMMTLMRQCVGAPSDLLAWTQFKLDFNKSYANAQEEARRRDLFTAELRRIESLNADPATGYKVGLNQMSDWTEEEFHHLLGLDKWAPLGSRSQQSDELDPFLLEILNSNEPVPHHIDWRTEPSRVGLVKDQGLCGSCWAFAATGLLEGQQVANNFTKWLRPLSEQQLLDCIPGDGCRGYWTGEALQHIAEMGGIMSDQDYEYDMRDHHACFIKEEKLVMATKGPVYLPGGDEEMIAKVVARYGPVAVSVAASSWKSYLSGIWPAAACEGYINHAVVIVGYGTDSYYNDYWLIKNSWGPHGEGGYIRLQRGQNACQITSNPLIARF